MSTEATNLHAPSSSSAADRMRRYRERRRKGICCVRVWLHSTDIEVLICKGYLDEALRNDQTAIQSGAEIFVSDALFEGAMTNNVR